VTEGPPTRSTVAGRAYLDLRSQAKKAGRATDEYLRLYALEGFLARLAESAQRDAFVVKGGVLLAAYAVRRPTVDIDLAGLDMSNDVETVTSLVLSAADTVASTDDGLTLDTLLATAAVIRDGDEYSGVRVSLAAHLSTAKLPFHVDVNVGDPIWPPPETIRVPRLLGGQIELLGYPLSMVLAEKLVTAAQRGAANTRWRDFADVYSLTRTHPILASEVHQAVSEVARHRRVDLDPLRVALAGYPEAGQGRWAAWRAKQRLEDRLPLDFREVVEHVLTFADGCFHALPTGRGAKWSPRTLGWH